MKDLFVLASPLIFAIGLGVAVAGLNLPAWARWPLAALAGLVACAASAWLTFQAWGMPFDMALWPVTVLLALLAMFLAGRKRRAAPAK